MNSEAADGSHEQLFAGFRHLISVVVAVVREDGVLIECNDGFRRLLQMSSTMTSGDIAGFFVAPTFNQLVKSKANGSEPGQAIHSGVITVGDINLACRSLKGTVHRDGSHLVIVAEFDVAEMEELNAQVISLNEQLSETQRELARSERSMRIAKQAADFANQAKSDFLSSMSHELRTPMNAILGFGQLLEMDEALGQSQKGMVREIVVAGGHLLELINEVLDLARIESGKVAISLEPVAVTPIIDECMTLMRSLAHKRGIHLEHSHSGLSGLKGAGVRADRTRLKQILINLLSNAIKYNRDGGSVRVEVRPAGETRLHLRVTDTGKGISAERLKDLFQPFNRLGLEKSNIEGTGIGLTISRRIVELMGGTLNVESQEGVGSSFCIDLPLDILPELPGDKTATNHSGKAQPVGADQRTILYIEDDPTSMMLVKQILRQRAHAALITADTPKMGIELAMTMASRPDLILLDINLPDMNGYQVMERFKAEPALASIPVLAITADAMPHDIKRGAAAGFAGYVTKPINVAMFLVTIDRILANAGGNGKRETRSDSLTE